MIVLASHLHTSNLQNLAWFQTFTHHEGFAAIKQRTLRGVKDAILPPYEMHGLSSSLGIQAHSIVGVASQVLLKDVSFGNICTVAGPLHTLLSNFKVWMLTWILVPRFYLVEQVSVFLRCLTELTEKKDNYCVYFKLLRWVGSFADQQIVISGHTGTHRTITFQTSPAHPDSSCPTDPWDNVFTRRVTSEKMLPR